MGKLVNIVGQKFNRLLVLEKQASNKGVMWKCLCDCGNITIVRSDGLRQNKIKSCGCLNNSPKKEIGYSAKYRKYDAYIRSAKKRNLIFELSLEEFIQITSQNCYYCGRLPEQITKTSSSSIYISNGIDRKNNQLGYILNNCLPCCK